MVDVKKLLEYNRIERHAFFEKFTGLPWEEFTKNREASFHSIRNIFVHTLNAIDFWLDFLQKQNICSRKRFDEFKSYDETRTYMEEVEKRMRIYLESVSPKMLLEKQKVPKKGKSEEVTTEDILVHVFEEELHHRGELIALLWQMNIEPPLVGYQGL